MQKVTKLGASGVDAAGINVKIAASQIRQTSLMVAVPASQETMVLGAEFSEAIAEMEELYHTAIEVVPVQNWR
jgi:hypothetical protein